jgi:hypothetical protein
MNKLNNNLILKKMNNYKNFNSNLCVKYIINNICNVVVKMIWYNYYTNKFNINVKYVKKNLYLIKLIIRNIYNNANFVICMFIIWMNIY